MNRQNMELDDEKWNAFKELLPSETGRRGRPAKDNRLIVDAIGFYVLELLGAICPIIMVLGIQCIPDSTVGQNKVS